VHFMAVVLKGSPRQKMEYCFRLFGVSKGGWMDGCMDGWMHGWMDGWRERGRIIMLLVTFIFISFSLSYQVRVSSFFFYGSSFF
jgi:hypothetical protein